MRREDLQVRIAVVGVGAVGGFFGGRLARAGEEVVFIARGETLAALRARGLVVESVGTGRVYSNPRTEPMSQPGDEYQAVSLEHPAGLAFLADLVHSTSTERVP